MADRTMKAGDTWVPLRGRATLGAGTADLTSADSVKVIVKHSSGTPVIVGVPTVFAPEVDDEGHEYNWEYIWEDGDTDTLGTYNVELEVTWDAASSPPKVQTFPNTGFQTLVIEDDLGGDR